MFRGFGSGISMRGRTKAILLAAALAVVGMLYVFSREPGAPSYDNCASKGIDPTERKEGTCQDEGTTDVVVNPGDPLELKTLVIRLDRMRESAAPAASGGKGGESGRDLVTFDLTATNRTDAAATLDDAKIVLYSGTLHMPDPVAERSSPTSLRSDPKSIAPGESVHGTIAFDVSTKEAEGLYENGNLDFGNLGSETVDYEPESLFRAGEIGIIRTEKDR